MKHLLTSAAVIAALAISAPAWAQAPGGNSMGMPGPSPGGPGLTPYSTGPRPMAAPPPSAAAPAMAPSAATSDTSSAMPPKHHRASRHASGKPSHHPGRFPNLQGNTVANQLNQAELARLQSGDFSAPPPPPGPGMSMPQDQSAGRAPGRMPAGGKQTSPGPTGR